MKPAFMENIVLPIFMILAFISCNRHKTNSHNINSNKDNQTTTFKPLTVLEGKKYNEVFLLATNPINRKVGLYNSNKEVILPTIFDEIYSGFVNPYYVVVVENQKQGLFDLEGNRICKSIYDGFVLADKDHTILGAYVGKNEKWIVINNKGDQVFSEEFHKIQFLPGGFVILQNSQLKSSLANNKGEFITKYRFDLMKGLDDNLADQKWFMENDIVATSLEGLKTIYINSRGEIVQKGQN